MNIFNYIKTKIQILDVISEYTSLKRAGSYWKGQCPFHNEKTASFTVSPHKEIFYCFGCHAGGDVITFISKIENYSQIEAAKHLAKTYNIDLPEQLTKELATHTKEKERYFTLCEEVANWCHEELIRSPKAMEYLTNRGFTQHMINLYNLGYFPTGVVSIRALTNYISKNSFMQDDLLDAKIIGEGQKATYSPFEERIMFPIKDIIGRYCGFGGRIFKEGDPRPKYYNSHENLYFNKGALLFGFDIAKKSLNKCDHMFMVEGYTDCIAMTQYGFTNTIATLGTACTQEHLKILSRYVNYIYILYDGDNAGKNAIIRLTELCWQVNIELKVVILPENEDPASFLSKNGDLNNLISESKDIFFFFIDTICQGFLSKPLSEKLKLANDIIKIINTIQDPLKRDILMQKASKVMQIPIDSITKINNNNYNNNNNEIYNSNNTSQNNTGYYKKEEPILPNINNNWQNEDLKLEKKIFFAIINNIELTTEENVELLLEYLPNPIKEIFEKFINNIDNRKNHDFVSFFETLKKDDKQYLSKLLLEFEDNIEKKTFEQLFLQFQKKHWKNIVKKIKENLETARKESDENKVAEILEKFYQLKKKILRTDLITK